jgi:hypothetical protein
VLFVAWLISLVHARRWLPERPVRRQTAARLVAADAEEPAAPWQMALARDAKRLLALIVALGVVIGS